jgi:hypothetical protein
VIHPAPLKSRPPLAQTWAGRQRGGVRIGRTEIGLAPHLGASASRQERAAPSTPTLRRRETRRHPRTARMLWQTRDPRSATDHPEASAKGQFKPGIRRFQPFHNARQATRLAGSGLYRSRGLPTTRTGRAPSRTGTSAPAVRLRSNPLGTEIWSPRSRGPQVPASQASA